MTTPEIQSYRFGQIIIDGQTHNQDVIILPDRVVGGWWRKEGHSLHPEDLDAVFEAAPEILVVGQGANGRMQVPWQTRQRIRDAGIELIAAPTEEAVQSYNELRRERDIAAALHLTC